MASTSIQIPAALSERRFRPMAQSAAAGPEALFMQEHVAEIGERLVQAQSYKGFLSLFAERAAEIVRFADGLVAEPRDDELRPVAPEAPRRAYLKVVSRRPAEPSHYDPE